MRSSVSQYQSPRKIVLIAVTTGPVTRVISSCHMRPRLMFFGEL